ncbi:MAG: flavin reductase family protein [Promethearchaeia archaeon]
MSFKILSVNKHINLLHPRQTILCTSQFKDKKNVITLAWTMIISRTPPIIAISIAPQRFSHDMIKNSKQFTINMPTKEIIKDVYYCGTHSGRNINKFEQTKLTPLEGINVKCPRIKECFAHIECKVIDEKTYGDHTLFIGEVLTCIVKEGLLKDERIKKVEIPYHLGANRFIYNKNEIEKI